MLSAASVAEGLVPLVVGPIYVYMYVCMCVRTYVLYVPHAPQLHAQIHVLMHACMHTYIQTYIHNLLTCINAFIYMASAPECPVH